MSLVSDTIRDSMGIDDEQAQSFEKNVRAQMEANGQNPSDEEIVAAIPQIVSQFKAKSAPKAKPTFVPAAQKAPVIEEVTTVAKPQVPTVQQSRNYNAPQEFKAASDQYSSALEKIKQKRNRANLGASILSRFSNNAIDDNNKYYDNEKAEAKDKFGEFETRNKLELQQVKSDQDKAELDFKNLTKDPNSNVSVKARELLGIKDETVTAAEISQLYPFMKDKIEQEYKDKLLQSNEELRKATIQYQRDNAEEQRALRRELAGKSADNARERTTNKSAENLGKDMVDMQNALTDIAAFEQEAKINLDEYDPKKNTVNGKKVDVPGVSIPLVGRVSAFSGDARQLQQRLAKIFNTVLKDRSGAAVTSSELERLKSEFGSGAYSSEADMLNALKQYKEEIRNLIAARKVTYSPEAQEKYLDRGGIDVPYTPPPGVEDGIMTISSKEEYDSLPAGTKYREEDYPPGKFSTKKGNVNKSKGSTSNW